MVLNGQPNHNFHRPPTAMISHALPVDFIYEPSTNMIFHALPPQHVHQQGEVNSHVLKCSICLTNSNGSVHRPEGEESATFKQYLPLVSTNVTNFRMSTFSKNPLLSESNLLKSVGPTEARLGGKDFRYSSWLIRLSPVKIGIVICSKCYCHLQ